MVKKHAAPHTENSLFAKRTSYLSQFVFFLFLSLAIIVLDHKYQKLESVRGWLNTLLYPVHVIANMPEHLSVWVKSRLVSKDTLLTESKSLGKQNLLLSQKLQKHKVLEVENQRLRNLLNMSARYSHDKVQIASVLRLDQSKNTNELKLDKGSRDGVYIGQPALDDKGLLGQIIHVAYASSTLLLLDSARHFTPVQVVRNSYRSVTMGNGTLSPLTLSRVREDADIRQGDVLVTSGMGGLFPVGYKVGTVSLVEVKKDHFLKVTIDTFSEHQKVEEVLLIWPATQSPEVPLDMNDDP